MILVVLLSVGLYFAIGPGTSTTSNGNGSPSPTPIGSVFSVALPEPLTCTSNLVTLHACVAAGDASYEVQVETSTIIFVEVLFQVQYGNGTIFQNDGIGSIALVDSSGVAAAYSAISAHAGLGMSSNWAHYGSGYSTVSTIAPAALSILIDLGQTSPAPGLYLVASGTNGCSGTTTPMLLN